MTCKLRCPLNGQMCDDCMNDEHPADEPDTAMSREDDDWDCNFSIIPHGAGTWGI